MRHVGGYRKLGRASAHRWALLRNLCTSLVEHERIETTVARAKSLRSVVEKCVTSGKRDTVAMRRRVANVVTTSAAVQKLFSDLAVRFKERAGGYTRIIRYRRRVGDGAQMALIEFVDYKPKIEAVAEGEKVKEG